jgi:hypothetical protein
MQNLSNLFTRARLSGRWIVCRIGRMWSTSSRITHLFTGWTHAFEPCRLPAPVPLPSRAPRLRSVALVPALMLSLAAAAPADAASGSRYELTADGRLVDVQVLVSGEATPLYFPSGRHDRRYFQAFRGRNYSLAITNNSGRRIGVLIAVDGLNVVNGERSRLASDEAMYVLDPWERTVIRGWRSSLHDVRKFVFVDEERSYAERTGQANGDMGWIRVLAFNERNPVRYDAPGRINQREPTRDRDEESLPYSSRDKRAGEDSKAQPAPEAQGQEGDAVGPRKSADRTKAFERSEPPTAQSVPGTGWGDRSRDPVRRVWFVPQPHASDHLVFRYEYSSGLRALGIRPRGSRDRLWERENGDLGFAQPPRW